MASGKISIQSNDGKIYSLTPEEGASANVEYTLPKDGGVISSKTYVDNKTSINSFIDKPTPDDTDNLALQEVGGLLNKLSFANLMNWIKSFSFGWGQTWQDVKVSRSVGVTYTNTTGKPIEVSISAYATNNGSAILTRDSTSTAWYMSGGGISDRADEISTIIPNGGTYSISSGVAGFTVYRWLELR